jgi:acyl carrier protein
MVDKEKILQAIFGVVDEMNRELPKNLQLTASRDTALFGQDGKLDSLGLVNFIVASEQKIREDFGQPITLADERAMSQRNSPFRTIGTLTDYIFELLKEQ